MPETSERDLQRLLAEEAFVRQLAAELVAADADEVVQRTWLCAVQQGGRGVERPRHWLARIVRNVVANLRRDDRRRRARENALPPRELVPSSQALAEREERRRELVAAVDALPNTLRTVVLWRWFDGRPPREIAKALGVPAATVSTQLQRALVLLRERLDAQHDGERRSWLVPLVPFALRPALPPAVGSVAGSTTAVAPALLSGAIVMTTKSKVGAAVAALVIGVGAWLWFVQEPAPGAHPPGDRSTTPAVVVQAPVAPAAAPVRPSTAGEREEVPAAAKALATTGTVVVHVRHADGSAAGGTMLTLYRPGVDTRYEGHRMRTDESGTARYENVSPGRLSVGNSLSPPKRVDVVAGQTVELTLDLAADLTITGIVVDAARSPVAGAAVEVTRMAFLGMFPEALAITGADGRFVVRACPTESLVGARAFGHVASPVRFVHGASGNTAEVELVLGRDGGAVAGTVVDATGKPVADAIVIVGRGELSGIPGSNHIPPFPALARTDVSGEFLAIGVAAGAQPIQVRALGCAPWTGSVDVVAGTTTPIRIALTAGATVQGHVLDAKGDPVDGAEVEVGEWRDLAYFRTRSAADGTWQLAGVPIGEVTVRSRHDKLGKATQTVLATAASTTSCELLLSRGLEFRGRLLDPDGQPVANTLVECMAGFGGDTPWSASARSDTQGRFVAANCPETGKVMVVVRAHGFEEVRRHGLDPRTEVQVSLRRQAPPTVRICGRIVDPDGHAVANATVYSQRRDQRGSSGIRATANDGGFELDPVVPGTWALHVSFTGHPEHRSAPQVLAADATWDLGTIALVRGGTAEIRVGAVPEGTHFLIVDALRTATWSVREDAKVRRTSVLAPGDYQVLVEGKSIATKAVPFTIRAGEQTLVEVAVQPGVEQAFQCKLPPGVELDGVSLRVLRNGAFVGRTWADVANDWVARSIGLAPGDYTVEAEAGDLRGRATFTVGAASGAPVTVTMQ